MPAAVWSSTATNPRPLEETVVEPIDLDETAVIEEALELDNVAILDEQGPSLEEVDLSSPILSDETPSYIKEQVLELCNEATMKVRSQRADVELKGDFTLEMWVRVESQADQRIVHAENLEIVLRSGMVKASVNGKELVGLKIVEEEWYHVALSVWDGQANLFVNGIPSGVVTLSDKASRPSGTITFGGYYDAGEAFCGKLDLVRLTGEVLWVDYFQPLPEMPKLDSAVFSYDFDNELGKTVSDKGYWGVNAKLSADAWMVTGKI